MIEALATRLGWTERELERKRVDFHRKHGEQAEAKLLDHLERLWEAVRERKRLLRSLPPAYVDRGVRGGPSKAEIEAAAEESAYTEQPVGLVPDAGEAVPAYVQKGYCKQAEENIGLAHLINQRRREQYELAQRLERAREDARIRGIDISSPERVIERQLERIERRVYEGKAA